ncbi:hypothetical protein [Frisingicoccus sp.]|uniref:hypothetical protein n=1 Tax=Frisingicoccus sp. TaxID=1918627 RepID=UPI003AB401BB
MLTIFNREELTVTFSLEELNRIQNILAENKLEYRVKSCLKGGIDRARMGSMGMNPEKMQEYIIYVHKDDFERAVRLIRRNME